MEHNMKINEIYRWMVGRADRWMNWMKPYNTSNKQKGNIHKGKRPQQEEVKKHAIVYNITHTAKNEETAGDVSVG